MNLHILLQLVEKKKWPNSEKVFTQIQIKEIPLIISKSRILCSCTGTIKILWLAPYQHHLYSTDTVTLAVGKYFNNNNFFKNCKTQVQLLCASCLVTAPVSSSLCDMCQCDARFLFSNPVCKSKTDKHSTHNRHMK